MILIVKLILAHLIGDFLLQPNSWVAAKEQKKVLAWQLYAHVAVHAFLILLFLWDSTTVKLIIPIVLSHFAIDAIKLYFQKENTRITWFVVDQFFHVLAIIFYGLYWLNQEHEILAFFTSEKMILLITALLFLTKPASIVLGIFVKPWADTLEDEKEKSLKNAGKYIGIIERILVFIFIISHHFEAVGFLIASKSVFRFGDLKESKDRKLTEYILIGTLLSFGIAIITGLLVDLLLKF